MTLSSHSQSFTAWYDHKGKSKSDTDLAVLEILRSTHSDHHVTRTSPTKCDLLGYAKAGFATVTQEIEAGYEATRVYRMPSNRLEKDPGKLDDVVNFGRWSYEWEDYKFIVYEVAYVNRFLQNIKLLYVLAPNTSAHVHGGYHDKTDALLLASGQWTTELHKEIWIFDDAHWSKNKGLWRSVQDASWDDVILAPAMKDKIIQDVQGFFDSQDMYRMLKVPWKRGIILHGVPGNGKTISIKALINSLASRPHPVQSLYVKSLDACSGPKWSLQEIFKKARRMAPCLLILEDLDSLVTDNTRSYFLNEVDGLDNNDGILMIGSTNHLDRLDPAVTKRPSRFDRKYHFKVPAEDERIAYCRYWRSKFTESDTVDFPDEICPLIAKLTDGYSFAYLKELFVTSLLMLARGSQDEAAETEDNVSTSSSDAVVVEKDTTTTDDKGEQAEEEVKKDLPKPKQVMPEVIIPEELQDNKVLKIIKVQAKLLFEEIDHTVDKTASKACLPAVSPAIKNMFRSPLDDGDDE